MRGLLTTLLGVSMLVVACGDDVDEAGARTLWDEIQTQDYRGWQRAPGYELPQPTVGAHGQTAIVFVNDVVADALSGAPLEAWPAGALLVKDSFSGAQLTLIAAMQKQPGGWFYSEWSASGEVKYAGQPDVCTRCHTPANDHVRVVALPAP